MKDKDKSAEEFTRLLNIIDELRLKCPWDMKQTNESLRKLTIEETNEENNVLSPEFGFNKIDLTVDSVSYDEPTETLTITVKRDLITGDCTRFWFSVSIDGGSPSTFNSGSGFSSADSYTLELEIDTAPAPTSLSISVDTGNVILESNEDNNLFTCVDCFTT